MRRFNSQPCRWALSIEHWAVIAALTISGAACGKKGPPLAPIVHIPAAVEQIEARRTGNEVAVTVTVPAKNIDGSVPIDIGRIEVYGYTGTAVPPRARFLEVGTLVGTVTVVSPPTKDTATPAAPAKPGDPIPGGPTSIVESLTPDALVAKAIPPLPTTRRQPRPLTPVGPAADVEAGPLRRFYFALAFSPGGRPGPPGAIAELRLTELPEAPLGVKATHVGDAVRLEWEPSGGLIGFLLDRPIPMELSPLDNPPTETGSAASTAPPDGPTRYNVYREIAAPVSDAVATAKPAGDAGLASPKPTGDTALVSPKPSGEGGPPAPINAAPLEALFFSDPLTGLDGRERCYVVRSVRGVGAQAVESHASEPSCVVPVDDFPPEPPSGLSATSGEGAITLMWVPNAEPDVAGYLVLRGEAGDATLAPVTDTVVTEARFTDRTVKPGVRYVYAVQAIDTRLPRPNVSGESARVDEVAR
jgi:predicted small lipoprotein YifL